MNLARQEVPMFEQSISRLKMPIDSQDSQLPKKPLFEVLDLLRAALQILDEMEAPAQLGAQVDLAVSRLETLLGINDATEH